ncbi:cytochrome P450 [Mycena olivaceomarginata]|nr:cytochrome P450 [Mycena olivaceomarginata]
MDIWYFAHIKRITCVKLIRKGNMLQLVFPSIYGEFEFEWQKKYGTVYRIKGLFGEDILMVSDPVALQHIMNNHNFIRAATQRQKGKLIFGERSVVQGWEQLCSAAGSRALVNTVADPTHPLAQTHLHVLLEFVVPSSTALNRSKADLFGNLLLPYIPTFILRGVLLPTAPSRALQRFRSVTTEIIQSKNEEQPTGSSLGNDVLSVLIEGLSGQRKEKLTPNELAEQVRIILLGGQDTSADALAWCLCELAKTPQYQEKPREEIELHRGRSNGGYYPAAPYMEREASEDCDSSRIGDYDDIWGAFLTFLSRRGSSFQSLLPLTREGDPYEGKALGPYANLFAHFSCLFDMHDILGWLSGLRGGVLRTFNTFSFREINNRPTRVLEMQIILVELVRNFNFALSKDDPVRPLYAGILVPITAKEVKGLPLFIERIFQ